MLLFATNCYGAEFLVRAKPNWMDSLKQEDIDKFTTQQKQSYEARSQIGDIVCVYPDGKLSDHANAGGVFVVIRIPDLDYKTAKDLYEQPLMSEKDKDGMRVMLRHRKYALPDTEIKAVALTTSKVATITKTAMDSKIITKTATASLEQ